MKCAPSSRRRRPAAYSAARRHVGFHFLDGSQARDFRLSARACAAEAKKRRPRESKFGVGAGWLGGA
jgi:hypothetical protein